MTGRRSHYTAAIAERILAELMNDRTLGAICRDPGMPSEGTVHQWVHDNREGFATRFRHCRKVAGPKGGGPTAYTRDVAWHILHELMDGRTLADVCRDPGMPTPSTVRNWATANRDGFAARYRRAREFGYGRMFDKFIEILDDARGDTLEVIGPDGEITRIPNPQNVARAELRATAQRWLLSKTLPRNYGERPNLLQRLKAREAAEKATNKIESGQLAATRGRNSTEHPLKRAAKPGTRTQSHAVRSLSHAVVK